MLILSIWSHRKRSISCISTSRWKCLPAEHNSLSASQSKWKRKIKCCHFSYHVWMQLNALDYLHLLHVCVHMWHFGLHGCCRTVFHVKSCSHVLCCLFLSFFLVHSGGDPEHQLRGDGPQFPVSTSPTSYLQAMLCVPGQVLRVPLRCQLLWGLQGEKNLPDPFELCFVSIYGIHLEKCWVARIIGYPPFLQDKKEPCRHFAATSVIRWCEILNHKKKVKDHKNVKS